MSEAEPTGIVSYTRKVMSGREFASLHDWLTCSKPLCPVVVRDTGRIEDVEPGVSQVCFLSPLPGDDTLRNARSQEALCHATHPELLVSALFQEKLEDNEAISVSGCVRSCRTSSGNEDAPLVSRLTASARESAVERQICGMDAENYGPLPAAQYDDDAVLRELNKAYLGFQQPKIAKRLSPIGESNCASPHASVSASPAASEADKASEASGDCCLEATADVGWPERTWRRSLPSDLPAEARWTPLARPATIGGPTADGSPPAAASSRQGVLLLIGQLQRSIERQLTQLGQETNSQIVSQIMAKIRTMERSRLVKLLSGEVPADASSAEQPTGIDEDALLTVCEALIGRQPTLQPLDDDYFQWRLEELAQQRCVSLTNGTSLSQPVLDAAACRNTSVETDTFFSACSSLEDDPRSPDDRLSDRSSGSAPLLRSSVSPDRPAAPLPRRRSTFRDRLKEADLRAAEQEMAVASDDDGAAAGLGVATQAAESDSRGQLRRTGSSTGETEDEVADRLVQDRRWTSRFQAKSRSLTGNSSRLSFSSDFSSEVEDLWDKFGHWLDEPGTELAPRDLAVMRVTQRLLKRTLSDTFAGVAMEIETLDSGARLPRAGVVRTGAESAAADSHRGPVRSLSLSDHWARERLVLEVARKLVEPSSADQSSEPSCAKQCASTVVEIIEAADAATLQGESPARLCPAIYRYSEQLVRHLVPECVRESALHLSFHKAKHRRAYRKLSARPERRLTQFPRRPAAAPPSPPPAATAAQLTLDDATVEGFSWTLAERLLEETLRQLPSPRRLLLDRLMNGRAHSLDRKGILKKSRSSVARSRSSANVSPPPPEGATTTAEVAHRMSGSLEAAQSNSLPGALDRAPNDQSKRRKSRRESFLESRSLLASGQLEASDRVRPIATGNWGCGRRHGGDPQLKAAIQWLCASRAEVPCLVYYTCGNPLVKTLQWVCGSVTDRHWTVGELASAVLAHCQRRLETAKLGAGRQCTEPCVADLFDELLRLDTPPPVRQTKL